MSELAKQWVRAVMFLLGVICLLGALLAAGMFLVGALFAFGDRWLGPRGGLLLVLASSAGVGGALCYFTLKGMNREQG